MWLFLGLAAIGVTFLGTVQRARGKDGTLWSALGLSLTALTLCAEYQVLSSWAIRGESSNILDVAPTMGKALWVLTLISIVWNVAPLIREMHKKKSNESTI